MNNPLHHAFACPECQAHTLQITRSLELPPDADNDEITLQLLQCASCGFQALGLYQESRHGRLDSASWRHSGLRVSAADLQAVRQAIQRCPQPKNSACDCPTHQAFGQREVYKWDGLRKNGVTILGEFRLRL